MVKTFKVKKTIAEINEKIRQGKAVVVTAEEMIDIVERHGDVEAARKVDVVTTGTFGPMCSSGAFLNFGHTSPRIKAHRVWLNDVAAYGGIAAVDCYIGAAEVAEGDPLNSVFPGEFNYGGGHVIEDLVAGNVIRLRLEGYGTDCYPSRKQEKNIVLQDLRDAILFNPRNCYQNYNVAVNDSDRTIYTYMGTLEPNRKNATYCSAGQLSPLLNDPYYETIGIGTKVWLAGAHGHVYAEGTQHAGACERTPDGVPTEGAGTLALTADMKQMKPEFVRGASLRGYGISLALGVGVPIPILNEQILKRTCVRDRDIFAPVIDYSGDYPQKTGKTIAKVNYEQLRRGEIEIDGKTIAVGSLSSYFKALEIANLLADEIRKGDFLLAQPMAMLPRDNAMKPLAIREKAS